MAEAPALPFWTDAYLGDTQHLTLEEHGAYIKLLIIAWRSADTSIPDNDKRIATMLGISKARWVNKLRPNIVVHPFFASFDGYLTQKRLTKEKKYVLKNIEQKSAAGIASALKKKETASTAVPTAKATAGQRPGNGSPTPIPIPTPNAEKEGTKVPSKKSRGTRLSPDWVLPDEWHRWAVDQGKPADCVEGIADRFRDYWIGAPKGVKLDWAATWRNWVRNEHGGSTGSKSTGQGAQIKSELQRMADEINEKERIQ